MKRFVITIAAILVLSGAWLALWFFYAGQVREGIEAYARTDGITQPRLTCQTLSMGGFPFSFSPRCENATITLGDYDVSLPDLRATALFYRPEHIQLFATGPARIDDAFTGTAQQVSWSALQASLRFENGRIARFSGVIEAPVYADLLFGEAEIGRAARAEIHLLDATPPDNPPGTGANYAFYALLEDLQSPDFAIADGRVVIDADISGVPDPALWGDPYLLAYWQALDGILTLNTLEAQAENLVLNASGAVEVGQSGRLHGELAIASQGLVEPIAALSDPSMAEIFIGSPDETGLSRQRISINEGTVTVGILPVLTLPPLY